MEQAGTALRVASLQRPGTSSTSTHSPCTLQQALPPRRQPCICRSCPAHAGTDHKGGPIHLPSDVLLNVLRGMAAPEAEAAWVPLVGQLPDWIDLNSDM